MIVTAITDLIEDWIQMRSTLQRQLKMLESSEMHAGDKISDSTAGDTIVRVRRCIDELNSLLKEYAISPKALKASAGRHPTRNRGYCITHHPIVQLGAYHIEVGGKIVGEIYKTQTKALSAYHALFAAIKRPRPRPSPAPQYAKRIGETVRVLTGPCTGHIGKITAVDGPSPITFKVQFAAPIRCAMMGEVAAVWKTMDELQFVDEPAKLVTPPG
jgi:hypothetical protein